MTTFGINLDYDITKDTTIVLLEFSKLLDYSTILNAYQTHIVNGTVHMVQSQSSSNFIKIILSGHYLFIYEIYKLSDRQFKDVYQQLIPYVNMNIPLSIDNILIKISNNGITLQPIDYLSHIYDPLAGTTVNDLKTFQAHLILSESDYQIWKYNIKHPKYQSLNKYVNNYGLL